MQEQIYRQIKEECTQRLKSNEIKSDPNNIPHDAWIDDVKQWPEIDDGKLFSYIQRKQLMWNTLESTRIRKPTHIG